LPKAAVGAIGVTVALCCAPRGRMARPVRWLLAVGAAVLLLAALLSAAPYAALTGRDPRFEGVLVLATYALAAVAGARLLGPGRSTGHGRWLAECVAVAALAVGLLAALEASGLRPLASNVSRPGSLLGNASAEGAFGVLALGVLLPWLVRGPWLPRAGAAAAALTVVLSGARGDLVALAVLVIAYAVLTAGRVRWLAAAGLVVLAAASFAVPATRGRITGANSFARATTTGRLLLIEESARLVARHPVLGAGPSGFLDAIPREHTRRWERTVGPADPPDSPHNVVLQAAAAGGVPLALLLLALVAYAAPRALRQIRGSRDSPDPLPLGCALALAGYGVALLAHFTEPGETILAATLFGGLCAAPSPPAAPASTEPRRSVLGRAAAVGAGVVALVLALGAVAELPLRRAYSAAQRSDVASADHLFATAHALRPWDADLSAAAGHAFAVLANDQVPDADAAAGRWLRRALAKLPASPQVLADLAAVAELHRDLSTARRDLAAAARRDPLNPELVLRRGVVEAEAGGSAAAERLFHDAADLAPDDPAPWSDLAVLLRQLGRTADAQAAERNAQNRTRSTTGP
jgi:O-antigen ligase/Flp pilus assembly protein TadD